MNHNAAPFFKIIGCELSLNALIKICIGSVYRAQQSLYDNSSHSSNLRAIFFEAFIYQNSASLFDDH